MFLETAAAVGLTLTAKILIGLATGGGGITIAAISAKLALLYRDYQDNQSKKLEPTPQLAELQMQRLDVLNHTVNETYQERTRLTKTTNTNVGEVSRALATLSQAAESLKEEGKNFKELVGELKGVIAEREKELQTITDELQKQHTEFTPLSKELALHKNYLIRRQEDLSGTVKILIETVQQLETKDKEWMVLNQRIKALEAQRLEFDDQEDDLLQNKTSLLNKIATLTDQLEKSIAANERLISAQKMYEETIQLMQTQIDNLTAAKKKQCTSGFFNN